MKQGTSAPSANIHSGNPPRAVMPPDKVAVRMTMGAWMLLGLPALILFTSVERAWLGRLPEPMSWAVGGVYMLPLGSALVRRDRTLRGNALFFMRWYAIAGGALLALLAVLRACRLS